MYALKEGIKKDTVNWRNSLPIGRVLYGVYEAFPHQFEPLSPMEKLGDYPPYKSSLNHWSEMGISNKAINLVLFPSRSICFEEKPFTLFRTFSAPARKYCMCGELGFHPF